MCFVLLLLYYTATCWNGKWLDLFFFSMWEVDCVYGYWGNWAKRTLTLLHDDDSQPKYYYVYIILFVLAGVICFHRTNNYFDCCYDIYFN